MFLFFCYFYFLLYILCFGSDFKFTEELTDSKKKFPRRNSPPSPHSVSSITNTGQSMLCYIKLLISQYRYVIIEFAKVEIVFFHNLLKKSLNQLFDQANINRAPYLIQIFKGFHLVSFLYPGIPTRTPHHI